MCAAADGDVQIVRIEESDEWLRDWGRAVVGAALADPAKLAVHRDKMVSFLLLFDCPSLRWPIASIRGCGDEQPLVASGLRLLALGADSRTFLTCVRARL